MEYLTEESCGWRARIVKVLFRSFFLNKIEPSYLQNLDKSESSEEVDRNTWKKTRIVIHLGMCTTNQFKLAVVASVNQITASSD